MSSVRSGAVFALAGALILLSAFTPMVTASSPTYATSAITQSGIKQTTINGYPGVLVNYTSTFTTSFGAFVYLDLMNSAGQTVYWNVGYCSFSASQQVQCFVAIAATVAAGSYTAKVFATTTTNVPVSTTGSLSVTL
ncbi:MAG: hypothetical protein KGI38_04455 [Thaumarchaeota archaeon]|nr:hypothetical protein [Nitrososphaerota archaeon]